MPPPAALTTAALGTRLALHVATIVSGVIRTDAGLWIIGDRLTVLPLLLTLLSVFLLTWTIITIRTRRSDVGSA